MITYEGDFAGIRSRKLSEEVCKKFNVRVDAGRAASAPTLDVDTALAPTERRIVLVAVTHHPVHERNVSRAQPKVAQPRLH